MNYKYISIPKSRLSKEWLTDNNFNPEDDINTFITYYITSDSYGHCDFVYGAEAEFICNTQKEFEQMINQIKLERIL